MWTSEWIKWRVANGTTLNADEANVWNDLHGRSEMKRINHEETHSHGGACTNWAESYSAVSVARSLAAIATGRGRTFSASLRRHHGEKTTAGFPTAIRFAKS